MQVGEHVGSYRLASPLGRGTTGVVYRAEHLVLGRPAALKLLAPKEDRATLERFRREARALARLQHPGLVQIFDCGVLPDGRRLPGHGAARRRAAGGATGAAGAPAALLTWWQVTRQLAEALEVVHAAGLVHRDVKPANIFLLEERGRLRVKLLDFGVAKPMGGRRAGACAPRRACWWARPSTCRPSSAAAAGAARPPRRRVRAGRGAVRAGQRAPAPFVSDALAEVVFAHLYQPPPSLRTLAPELPELVDRVVQRALAKSPDDRFPCALAVATALAPAATQPEEATARRALTTSPMMAATAAPPQTTPTPKPKPTTPPPVTTRVVPMVAAPLRRPTRPMQQPRFKPTRRRRWPLAVIALLDLVWRCPSPAGKGWARAPQPRRRPSP